MLTPTPGEPRISISEKDKGSTDTRSPTNTSSDNAGIAGWEIALIATFTTLVFLLALIIVGLVLGILVYRRWKVEQMKKTLLEIRPAHFAIGSYNYTVASRVFSVSFVWVEISIAICFFPV